MKNAKISRRSFLLGLAACSDAGQDCIKKSGYVAVGPQTTVTIVD